MQIGCMLRVLSTSGFKNMYTFPVGLTDSSPYRYRKCGNQIGFRVTRKFFDARAQILFSFALIPYRPRRSPSSVASQHDSIETLLSFFSRCSQDEVRSSIRR